MLASFRSRPLDASPYTFIWINALTQKAREGVPVFRGAGLCREPDENEIRSRRATNPNPVGL